MIYLGLMSGTSLDGIDVTAVRFEGEEERPAEAELVACHTSVYEPAFRERLGEACRQGSPAELCELNFELGRRFGEAIGRFLRKEALEDRSVAAIGSGGQTVWHSPPCGGTPGSTLQIGEPAVIAEETGIPVVADFRVRDVAAGGHGAPLAAYFDRLLLASEDRSRGIQNIGGMGNLTALPSESSGGSPVAFDTGPGVALLDAAVEILTEGEERCDRDGERAAAGRVRREALDEWLDDPFFGQGPPRSTGRERFGPARLEAWLSRHETESAEDLLATLTELTARSIADSLRWVDYQLEELFLCGGGARNPELVRRLETHLAPRPVRNLAALGWNGDAREAAAFALLARQHLLGYRAAPRWATGARRSRILGKRVPV